MTAATAPRLDELLDLELLESMVADGYIRVGRHPVLPHTVLDYSASAQYDRVWNAATKMCRGLLVSHDPFHDDAIVIARPFGKFANAGEHGADSAFGPLPVGDPFEVFEKVDGSLAIAYIGDDGLPAISTRGSYVSDQAVAATALWRERYSHIVLPETSTLLFEFVAPWNRIVVSYGDELDLVLLAHIDRRTGADLPLPDWPGRVVRRFDGLDSFDAVLEHAAELDAASNGTDAEGFVLRFMPEDPAAMSTRTKVKLATYCELHRIVTNMTPRTIWEHLAAGGTVAGIADAIPDEYHGHLRAVSDDLFAQHDARIAAAEAVLADCVHLAGTRREFAAKVFASTDRATAGLVFGLLDGHDVSPSVWKSLRPEHDPQARFGAFS